MTTYIILFTVFLHLHFLSNASNASNALNTSNAIEVNTTTPGYSESQRVLYNSKPIVLMMTHEGLTSHIVQIHRLWVKAKAVKRGVQAVCFTSSHYPDAGPVCLCDLFNFPSEITCTRASLTGVNKWHNCILIQKQETWSSHAVDYLLPQNATRNPQFHFTDVDCIAGFFHGSEGILPSGVTIPNPVPKFDVFDISNHYKSMLPNLKNDLQLSNQGFVVMHWRRGDQLQLRCPETTTLSHINKMFNDTSVNCHSVDEFISLTKSLLQRYKIINASVVVATNEQAPEQLEKLHKAGYKTTSLLRDNPRYQKLNSLDFFMLDMLMMMDCKWLFEWGESAIHDFLNDYLGRNKIRVKRKLKHKSYDSRKSSRAVAIEYSDIYFLCKHH